MGINKSFILGIASTLAIVAFAGGAYYAGKNSSNPQNTPQVASEANREGVKADAENQSVATINGLEGTEVSHTESIPAPNIKKVIASVMDEQYGKSNYRAPLNCWEYTSSGSEKMWCLKPISHKQIGNTLYFFATSDNAAASAEAGYETGHLDPGLIGIFAIQLKDKGYRYLAATKDIEAGSMGACGCNDAKFVKITPQKYALVSTFGMVNQGIVSSFHSILTPIGGSFKEVSSIPEIREGEQEITYKIQFLSDATYDGFYPLSVKKTQDNQVLDTKIVKFDSAAQVYKLPDNF